MASNEPTTVRLADGTTYAIAPVSSDQWGTFPWVRQANLISVAYRQIGDTTNADRWASEWRRRTDVWNALESGRDKAAVLIQFGKDALTAPLKIAADIGTVAIKTGSAVVGATTATLSIVPLVLLGLVVVLGIGFHRGSIRVVR